MTARSTQKASPPVRRGRRGGEVMFVPGIMFLCVPRPSRRGWGSERNLAVDARPYGGYRGVSFGNVSDILAPDSGRTRKTFLITPLHKTVVLSSDSIKYLSSHSIKLLSSLIASPFCRLRGLSNRIQATFCRRGGYSKRRGTVRCRAVYRVNKSFIRLARRRPFFYDACSAVFMSSGRVFSKSTPYQGLAGFCRVISMVRAV